MRFLVTVVAIIIALLVAPSSSHAADALTYTCSPGDTNASRFWVSMDGSGYALAWFCKKGTGWDASGFVGHWDELDGDWIQQVAELTQGTKAQRKALWDARINKQPATTNYDSVRALYRGLIAANRVSFPLPPQIPPPVYVVPNSSTGTSPAYTRNADQTRNTKAVAGVRVPQGTVCDGTKRLGTTNYYFVPNIGGTVGLYVNCILKK